MSSPGSASSIARVIACVRRLLTPATGGERQDLHERALTLFKDHPGREYTFEHLYLLLGPPSPARLSLVLDDLTKRGMVSRIYRVESPSTHVGLRDFDSITDVPATLYDSSRDEDLEVGPDDIRPIFRVA